MKITKFASLIIFCFGILIAGTGQAQNSSKGIAVVLEQPKQKITDLALVDRLNNALAVHERMNVFIPGLDTTLSPPPSQRFNLEQLMAWGHEVGCKYIMYLQLGRRAIDTRKQTSIPLVLSRYVVEGRVEGTYTLIDLSRNRVTGCWKLNTRITGPRQWQVADDYPDDPDLFIPAPQKVLFLQKLEDTAVNEIITAVRPHLRGR